MIDPIGLDTRLTMLLHNLIGVAILFLVYLLIWLFLRESEKRTLRKIALCNDIDQANALRIRLRKRRVRVMLLSAIGVAIVATTTVLYVKNELFVSSFVFTCIVCLFLEFLCLLFFNGRLNAMLGHIQPMSLDQFYSCKRLFCLFLRGFSTDELSHDLQKVENAPRSAFSEVHYIKDVERQTGVKVFAVGNPKELDCPYGAQRVYLDNATWKEDVQVMMECSRQIHIRLCDTESCLWELKQAQRWLDKVVLVVDDMEAYMRLRKSKALDLDLPPLDSDIGWTLYVMRHVAGSGWKVTRKKLSPQGYVSVENASDKGKPLRVRLPIVYYALIFMFFFGFLYTVPDIVTLAKEFNEWRASRKRLGWSGEQWAAKIEEKCPLLVMKGCSLSHSSVEQDCFVFSIDVSDDISRDSLCPAILCNGLLNTVFLNDDPGKKMFYEKIYLVYHFIKIHLSIQDGDDMTFSITEDDMIEMGLFRWHIPSHRSEEEQKEFVWSLWSPPIHA